MKCEDIQAKILLAESDELSPRAQHRLEEHLQQCAACRDYRRGARALTELAGKALPAGEPNGWVITRIRAEAAARAPVRVRLWQQPAARILAAAALIAVLLGGPWLFTNNGSPPSRVTEMHALVALVAVDDALQVEMLKNADYAALSETAPAADSHEGTLETLARQLLIMEGLAFDEEDGSWLSSPAEPPPTALQQHSSGDARDRIYG